MSKVNEAKNSSGVATESPRTALLPCPFCGADPEVTEEDGYEDIECANAACLVQPKALGTPSRPSEQTWNTRNSAGRGNSEGWVKEVFSS